MSQYKHFTLDNTKPKIEFNLLHSFSGVSIKRIQFPSLSGKPVSEWLKILGDLTLSHNSIRTDGLTSSNQILLRGKLSSTHYSPIIDENIFFPLENNGNIYSSKPFYNFLGLELIKLNEYDVPVTFFYEPLAGVTEKQTQ